MPMMRFDAKFSRALKADVCVMVGFVVVMHKRRTFFAAGCIRPVALLAIGREDFLTLCRRLRQICGYCDMHRDTMFW